MASATEQSSGRLTAILILAIVLIVVYLACFHWFILRHLAFSEEIGALSEQLGRFERVAAQRADFENLLQDLQQRKSDENLFLPGSDFNEAAAGMSEHLSQMISVQAADSCQIVSRQPVRPRVEERFPRVTVNVRMRCGIEDLQKVLYSLETGVPMIIADEVTVIKPRSRRRRGEESDTGESVLDIRFNMSGYLREAS